MLCIRLTNNDPFFCLAAEEYLLKQYKEDIFILWQSVNTVVVGKHQNAMAEINHPYVYKNKICVARRISGGGTVFHDEGNVNFAYLLNVAGPSEISFGRFMKPIIEALARLDVQAVSSGRNDLLVDGKKISGNAEHIFKNRVLHHGTLLFDSNLKTLGQSIKVTEGKYIGKAVQSKRSVVTNILPYLKKIETLDEFISFLMNFHLEQAGASLYELTNFEIEVIKDLAAEKFTTWDWNYGYSPKYTFANKCLINGKPVHPTLQVVKGHITEAAISGDYFTKAEAVKLAGILEGERHFYIDIRKRLEEIHDSVTDELVFAFF
jgi:lipoate---protein ligase